LCEAVYINSGLFSVFSHGLNSKSTQQRRI